MEAPPGVERALELATVVVVLGCLPERTVFEAGLFTLSAGASASAEDSRVSPAGMFTTSWDTPDFLGENEGMYVVNESRTYMYIHPQN